MSPSIQHRHLLPPSPLHPAIFDEYDDPVAAVVRPSTEDHAPVLAQLVGIPFDTTSLGRRGSRYGPQAVREALAAALCYNADFGVDLARARVRDCGDVDVLQTNVEETWRRVSEVTADLAQGDFPLVVLGGDHGLTFPVVRGLAQAVPGPIGVISIDSHFDVRVSQHDEVTAGVPFRYILEQLSGFVHGRNLVEIGIGGWRNSSVYAKYLAESGSRVISARELHRGDLDSLIAEALGRAGEGTGGIWLTIDIDGVDASQAPGTGSPAIGGVTSTQLLEIMWAFGSDPKAVGMDVMEVAPVYDHNAVTAHLAATCILTFLGARHTRLGAS